MDNFRSLRLRKPVNLLLVSLVLCSYPVSADNQARQVLRLSTMESISVSKVYRNIVTEAYRMINTAVQIVEFPAKRSLVEANSGQSIDGELFRIDGIQKQYTNLLRVNEPLSIDQFYVFSIKPIKIEGPESLKGYRLAVKQGLKYQQQISKDLKNKISVSSNQQIINLMRANRIDAFLSSDREAMMNKLGEKIPGLIRNAPPIHRSAVYHYLNKKHASLAPKLAAAIRELRHSGKIQLILDGTTSD